MPSTAFVRVIKRIAETPSATTLILEPAGWGAWRHHAGQFITLVVRIQGKTHYRCYSLASTFGVDPYPMITVKRAVGGVVSNHINDQVQVGDRLEVIPPEGDFTPVGHGEPRTYVAIGAGSGLTPLFGLAKAILTSNPLNHFTLIAVNKHAGEIFYRTAWESWRQKRPTQLQLIHALTAPEKDWKGLTGRLTPLRVADELQFTPKGGWRHAHYLLCAPRPMMADWHTFLTAEKGVAPAQIHREDFKKALSLTSAPATGPAPLHELIFEDEEGNRSTAVGRSDQTLLEAALAAGIPIPYSCQGGRCHLCKVKLLEGKVVAHAPEKPLTAAERSEGYLLSCQCTPQSAQIRLGVADGLE